MIALYALAALPAVAGLVVLARLSRGAARSRPRRRRARPTRAATGWCAAGAERGGIGRRRGAGGGGR
ncbi:MAG: hypothetical protein ACKORK_08840, partial [Gemmatimonadota bacterium]